MHSYAYSSSLLRSDPEIEKLQIRPLDIQHSLLDIRYFIAGYSTFNIGYSIFVQPFLPHPGRTHRLPYDLAV